MSTAPVSAEIAADRERIRSILSLPEAADNPMAAIAVALAGASVADAKTALIIASEPLSADEVAASINKQFGGRK